MSATYRTRRRRGGGRGRGPRRGRHGRAGTARSARRAPLQLGARVLAEGEAQRGRLEPRLGELALGVRVGHDAATGVVANDAVRYYRRPDGEPELEVATRVEEAEGAGVRAARDRLQLRGEGGVVRAAVAAWARALDGARLHSLAAAAEEELGRVGEEAGRAHVEVGAVRHRVAARERGEERPRRRRQRRRVGLRQIHLVDVARGQVVEDAADGGQVALAGEERGERRRRERPVPTGCGGEALEPRDARA